MIIHGCLFFFFFIDHGIIFFFFFTLVLPALWLYLWAYCQYLPLLASKVTCVLLLINMAFTGVFIC